MSGSRRAAIGVAVLVLAAGGWIAVSSLLGGDGGKPGQCSETAVPDREARAEPRLEGRRAAPAEAAPPAPGRRLPAPADAAMSQALAESVEAIDAFVAEVQAMKRLRDEVLREVEPQAWTEGPTPPRIGAQRGALVVKAPPWLQDAVAEWLEARRGTAGVGAAAPDSPTDRDAGLAEVRAILARMAVQEARVFAWYRALREGRRGEATEFGRTLREEEPDLELEVGPRFAIYLPAAAEGTRVRVPARTLASLFPERLDAWVRAWPGPARRAALADGMRRAGLERLALRGDALRSALEHARVTLSLEDGDVFRVLREVQVAALVDVVVDPSVREEVATVRLPRFDALDRPATFVLDRLRDALPAGFRFTVRTRFIHLVKDGVSPQHVTQIHSVADLVAGPDETEEPPAAREGR